METDEQIELIAGYERWRRDQAQKEVDDSPRAYIEWHRKHTLLDRLKSVLGDEPLIGMGRVLALVDLTPDEKNTLQRVLSLGEAVLGEAA